MTVFCYIFCFLFLHPFVSRNVFHFFPFFFLSTFDFLLCFSFVFMWLTHLFFFHLLLVFIWFFFNIIFISSCLLSLVLVTFLFGCCFTMICFYPKNFFRIFLFFSAVINYIGCCLFAQCIFLFSLLYALQRANLLFFVFFLSMLSITHFMQTLRSFIQCLFYFLFLFLLTVFHWTLCGCNVFIFHRC